MFFSELQFKDYFIIGCDLSEADLSQGLSVIEFSGQILMAGKKWLPYVANTEVIG